MNRTNGVSSGTRIPPGYQVSTLPGDVGIFRPIYYILKPETNRQEVKIDWSTGQDPMIGGRPIVFPSDMLVDRTGITDSAEEEFERQLEERESRLLAERATRKNARKKKGRRAAASIRKEEAKEETLRRAFSGEERGIEVVVDLNHLGSDLDEEEASIAEHMEQASLAPAVEEGEWVVCRAEERFDNQTDVSEEQRRVEAYRAIYIELIMTPEFMVQIGSAKHGSLLVSALSAFVENQMEMIKENLDEISGRRKLANEGDDNVERKMTELSAGWELWWSLVLKVPNFSAIAKQCAACNPSSPHSKYLQTPY